MARMSLYLTLGLIVGGLLVNAIARDPGYLLLAWGDWQIETSVWLALATFILACVLLWMALRFLGSVFRAPLKLSAWFGLRSARGAQRQTDKGFAAFYEGRWEMAEKALRKTRTVGEQTLLHPLYEALSAMHCGNADRAFEVLDRAEGDGTLPLSVVAMARAQCHLLAESYEQTHQALAALSTQDLQTPRAIAIRCELAFQQSDWQQLTELLPGARRGQLISAITLASWEQQAWLAVISEGKESATTAWKRAPDTQKAENSALWPALIARLTKEQAWDSLYKVLAERLERHCELSSLDAIAQLPDRLAIKLKKFVKRWSEKETAGHCLAALAALAEREGDSALAGTLWEEAYTRQPIAGHAVGWARWLRSSGQDDQAATLEAEALSSLRSAQQI